MSDGVSPSPKGAKPARPPSKSATVKCTKFYYRRLSVRPSLRWSLALNVYSDVRDGRRRAYAGRRCGCMQRDVVRLAGEWYTNFDRIRHRLNSTQGIY